MTTDQLFEQMQQNLADEVEKEKGKAKYLPIPFKIGPGGSLQTAAEQTAIAALERLGLRAYALADDPVARAQFGAVAIACQRTKLNLVRVLETLAGILPGWRQEWRPADDAGEIPELPIDKVTGLRARNPFEKLPKAKGSTGPNYDYKSQNVLKETAPRLAKWLQDCARFGGPTLGMLDELEAEKIEAQHLRKLVYGREQWQANKLRKNSGATLTEMNLFARAIEDPKILQAHRAEAKLAVPALHFDNLTYRMQIAKRDPAVREVHKTAGELFKTWQAEAQQKQAA